MEASKGSQPNKVTKASASGSTTCVSDEEDRLVEEEGGDDILEIESVIYSQTIQPWDPSDYTLTCTLQDAVRNYGRVDRMESLSKGKVAVKRMPTKWVRLSADDFDATYPTASEKPWHDLGVVKYLFQAGYPYVCEPHGLYQDGDWIHVVSALATHGDLFSWCDNLQEQGPHREEALRPVIRQAYSAVAWLHNLGIAHRDISLENILITQNPGDPMLRVKLVDFGMCTLFRACHEVRGKLSYQAPEMHLRNGQGYDAFLADSFSLGVVLYCLAAQDYPWQATKPAECTLFRFISEYGLRAYLLRRKHRKFHVPLAKLLSETLVNLLEGQLALKPEKRLHLGETCWHQKDEYKNRKSVWTCEWIDEWNS